MVKGFNFKKVIFSREHQPTQLGTEIDRPHVNFATSKFPLKVTVSNNFIKPIFESAWKHASVSLTKYILIWHHSKLSSSKDALGKPRKWFESTDEIYIYAY